MNYYNLRDNMKVQKFMYRKDKQFTLMVKQLLSLSTEQLSGVIKRIADENGMEQVGILSFQILEMKRNGTLGEMKNEKSKELD